MLFRKLSLDELLDFSGGQFSESESFLLKSQCLPDKTLEHSEQFNPNFNYGKIDASNICFTILLSEHYVDIGIYTDFDFSPSATPSPEEVSFITRISGVRLNKYLTNVKYFIDSLTGSRLNEIDAYDDLAVGKNYADDQFFTGLIQKNLNHITYVIEDNQFFPIIQYKEYLNLKRIVYDDKQKKYIQIPVVESRCSGEGWNEDNSSLRELVKDDIFIGISGIQNTENNLSIDRGNYSVLENHYIMSEVETLEDLQNYRNNYFKI